MFPNLNIRPDYTNFPFSDLSKLLSKINHDTRNRDGSNEDDEMSCIKYCWLKSANLNARRIDTNTFSNCTDSLNELRILRGSINWEMEEDRWKFLHRFYSLIKNWRGQLPNLRDLFQEPEIDRLLEDSVVLHQHQLIQDDDPGRVIVEFVARTGYKDELLDGPQQLHRTTALHRATRRQPELVKNLFKIYSRYDANYVDATGLTHFHIACEYGFLEVVSRFLEAGQDPNCVWRETGETPLHLALRWGGEKLVELLLVNGADPNLANGINGLTPLHVLCEYDDEDPVATTFFQICDRLENRHRLNLDARDNEGNTPLRLTLRHGNQVMLARLLSRGADPNLRDKEGSTPLHLALRSGNWTMAELLLKAAADPGLVTDDEEGATALHIVCQRKDERDIDSVKKFLEIVDVERRLLVQMIDAKDKKGRTALQWAVANLLPYTVDQLLDRGADLSNFVFPSESHYGETFPTQYVTGDSKLKLACRALLCLDCLEKRGYRLDRSDALTIVKLFVEFEMFVNPVDRYLQSHEEFASRAKNIKIESSQSSSLYELFESRPLEAAKLIMIESPAIPPEFFWYYELQMCEMVSRRFGLRWAVYPFWELIKYRLPVECCEMIVDWLNNKDLFNVILAAASSEKNVNLTDVAACSKVTDANGDLIFCV